MKKNSRRRVPGLEPVRVAHFKAPGVDLGALQAEFVASGRAVKSAASKLNSAQEQHDKARQLHNAVSEKLKTASRAVLAEA